MGPGYIESEETDNITDDNVTQVDFDPDIIMNTCLSVNIADTNNVKDLSHATMRENFVSHFDILFTRGEVQCPKR